MVSQPLHRRRLPCCRRCPGAFGQYRSGRWTHPGNAPGYLVRRRHLRLHPRQHPGDLRTDPAGSDGGGLGRGGLRLERLPRDRAQWHRRRHRADDHAGGRRPVPIWPTTLPPTSPIIRATRWPPARASRSTWRPRRRRSRGLPATPSCAGAWARRDANGPAKATIGGSWSPPIRRYGKNLASAAALPGRS